jgi:hypothetical protein
MHEPRAISRLVHAAIIAALLSAPAVSVRAQQAGAAAAPAHPKVCADGVREFYSRAELTMTYDTLTMPPMDGPMRVTSPEEAEAAQRMMREQAGSVGATGLLVFEETHDDGNGRVQLSRSVTPIYAPSDTARAYAACRKKPAGS